MEGVFTIEELQNRLPDYREVDAVTCATFAVVSAVSLVLEFPFAEPGRFKKAIKVTIDGEETLTGPAPNETLGIVDGIASRPLFVEKLLSGKSVKAIVTAEKMDGSTETIERNLSLEDFSYTKLLFTRVCVKNYMGFVSDKPVKTIFSAEKLNPGEFTFSGCGALNPLEHFKVKPGEKIFIAGTVGIVTGNGTRSTPKKPNLSVMCDLKDVKKEYFGLFKTGGGTEYYVGLGIKKSVESREEYKKLTEKRHENIPLLVANVVGRKPIATLTYSDVWKFNDTLKFNREKCQKCNPCLIEEHCPAEAFSKEEGFLTNCMFCGRCINLCPFNAVEGDIGTVMIDGKEYKITFRQSSIKRAREIAQKLKNGYDFDKIVKV
ncbi:homocysteine biosynthesis protein [Desulfurobacterium sp.]